MEMNYRVVTRFCRTEEIRESNTFPLMETLTQSQIISTERLKTVQN